MNKNNKVVDVGQQDISKQLEKKKKVIKNTVAEDANKQEFEMFMHLAKQYQLDPFQKEIFFWKKKGRTNIMTSRDGYLKIANRNPNFDGMDSSAIYPSDKFKKTDKGVKHHLNVKSMNKKPIGAYAVVYRKDRSQPTTMVVPFKEYNKPGHNAWQNFPSAMIVKVAESMALKRAFSVSGLVSKEEIEHQDKDGNKRYEPIDVTEDSSTTPEPQQSEKKEPHHNIQDMTLEKAKNYTTKGDKFGGKKFQDCPTGYLEWVAENWRGEPRKKAAKMILEAREDDEDNMSDRNKEIKRIVDENKSLQSEVKNFLKKNNVKSVDDLEEEKFYQLVDILHQEKTDEELAAEAAEVID